MKNINVLLAMLFFAMMGTGSLCNKDDNDDVDSQDTPTTPAFSIDFNGNVSSRWQSTKIEKVIKTPTGVAITFSNNGPSVYHQSLKTTYPGLTERFFIAIFQPDLTVGNYRMGYGSLSQGNAEWTIQQDESLSSANVEPPYRIAETGPESYFRINKIENNKISGVFYFYMFQPITGASSLKIIECKGGVFENIPIN